ncbi:MAG: RagB/SusD family nutrient uptake outer membrane protein [Paludibacter sp.]
MKKLILLLSIASMLFGINACSDLLNETPYTKITTDYISSTPAGMASAVLAMYEKDREMFRTNVDAETTVWTDLIAGDDITYMRTASDITHYTILPTTGNVASFWKQKYAQISYANLVIAAAAKVDMTSPVAIQALAEAKIFRAHAYFWLIRKFDRIYLTTRVTTPQNINDTIKYAPAVPDSIFKLINTDLDYAISHLSWSTTQPGRFTQGAARHIKAKVAAWQQNWQEVANQVNAIDKSGKYSLLANPADAFGGGIITTTGDLNNTETILVSQWSAGLGGEFVNPTTGALSGHRMPLIFAPKYNAERGMQIDYASGAYPWGRVFPNNYLLGLYDQTKDNRFKTLYKLTWTYNLASTLPVGKKLGDTLVATNLAQYLNVHPMCTKFCDSYTRTTPSLTESYKDIIIYRVAETYLMGAEAYSHIGKADSAAYYYNKTWVRAGNVAIPVGSVTMNMIIDEHARELAFEGDRWFFLKRNGLLYERVKKYAGEYLKKGTLVLNNDTILRNNIQPFHVRWPIPQAQIDIMGAVNFPQNTGY